MNQIKVTYLIEHDSTDLSPILDGANDAFEDVIDSIGSNIGDLFIADENNIIVELTNIEELRIERAKIDNQIKYWKGFFEMYTSDKIFTDTYIPLLESLNRNFIVLMQNYRQKLTSEIRYLGGE